MKLYHYTIGTYLPQIVEDREIKLSTGFLDRNVRPAAWFTTNLEWDQTANKMILDKRTGELVSLSMKETELAGNGLVRIAIDAEAAPHTWWDYKRLAGEKKKMLSALLDSARAEGSDPEKDWRMSFVPIGSEHWLSIDVWDGQEWKTEWSKEEVWEDK